MQRRRSFALLAAAIVFGACMASESEDGQPGAAAGPSDGYLDTVLTTFVSAMRAKDAAPVMMYYADDAVSYSPNAAPISGKAAITEYNKQWFASIEPDSLAAGRDGLLRGGDIAVETGWYYFKGKMFGQPGEDRGRYINVWQRQSDGSWKIVRDMANSSLPVPGTPPASGAAAK